MNIPIAKTIFSEQEFENILNPLKTGWVVQGPYVAEFEKKWSVFTGAKYSVAVSNCTTALHLSLAALGVGHGDEVIVPSFTWVATANAVESLGAKPVFCDIDLRTFNIDVNEIDKLLSDKTMAIIPVHLFGLAANMKEVMSIASGDSIFVIEDAACGFGAKYKGKHVGNLGDTGCFSFHPRKAITTGEGGMVTVNNKMLAEKLRAMRDHGATTSDHQRHFGNKPYLLPEFPYLGFNYRMTDIQASIGTTQMDRADDIHNKRVELADKYDEFIDTVPWLEKPFRDKDYEHGFQAYVCLFKPEEISIENVSRTNKKRNAFMDYLQQNGIATRPGTHAVHMLEYYAKKYKIKPKDYPNAWFANHCSIAFPLFTSLNDEEFEYITDKIKNYDI